MAVEYYGVYLADWIRHLIPASTQGQGTGLNGMHGPIQNLVVIHY